MQNSLNITLNTTQKLSLSKNIILSLSILTLNSSHLFQFIDNIVLSNPILIFSNRNFLKNNLNSLEHIADDRANLQEEFLNKIADEIENSTVSTAQKKFLLDVLYHFLDEKLFLQTKLFLKKYKSEKYLIWLKYFQRVIPAGIASRHLQERFKHQLQYYVLKTSVSYKIVDECWKYFLLQDFSKISKLLKKSSPEISSAILQIKKYCKIHLQSIQREEKHLILTQADVILNNEKFITLNERFLPDLKINEKILHLKCASTELQNSNSSSHYIRTQLNQARFIINAIQKRNDTLLFVTKTILELHKSYFHFPLSNNPSVRLTHPLNHASKITLKEISTHTNLSQSTISRAIKNKTILTSQGIKMLKHFLKPLT